MAGMQIYILRHGPAGESGDPKYPDDTKRPLTEEGWKKMKKAARGMQHLEVEFDSILTSPYVRAYQTAEAVVDVYGSRKKLKVMDQLIPSTAFPKLLKEIKENYKSCESLILVGHEPHLSSFISYLLCGDSRLSIELKKGALCKLTLETLKEGTATLNWLMTAGQLAFLGG